jgi:hypothetical protein
VLPATKNGLKNRMKAIHVRIINGHHMTTASMTRTALHVAHQNHHPTTNQHGLAKMVVSQVLAKNRLAKNRGKSPGKSLGIGQHAQMMIDLSAMTSPKKIEIATARAEMLINQLLEKNHHSEKNRLLEKNLPSPRTQTQTANDVMLLAEKVVTKAETPIGMIQNLIIVEANPPLPKLANQNQSQIAVQEASQAHAQPHHGRQVVKNACAGKNNSWRDLLILN